MIALSSKFGSGTSFSGVAAMSSGRTSADGKGERTQLRGWRAVPPGAHKMASRAADPRRMYCEVHCINAITGLQRSQYRTFKRSRKLAGVLSVAGCIAEETPFNSQLCTVIERSSAICFAYNRICVSQPFGTALTIGFGSHAQVSLPRFVRLVLTARTAGSLTGT